MFGHQQQGKLLAAAQASHAGASLSLSAPPPPIQLPASVPEKAVQDDPGAWAPAAAT